MEAFADYAMDASGTKEETMFLRMAKNSVDFDAAPGAYIADTGSFHSAYIEDTGSIHPAYIADTGSIHSAYDGDRLVGFTLIGIDTVEDDLTAYDAGTGIVPDFRGKGLAKAMFDHALPILRSRGVTRFLLKVLQSNEPAIKAYQKSGFEIVRELKCFVAETESLRQLTSNTSISIRPIDPATFESLIPEADWSPSFENRFTAHVAIPDQMAFLGAYDGEDCIGAISYCPELNWLLSLLVKRTHRHRGVGRSLLQHLASSLLPSGAPKLAALNVDGADTDMQAFFEAIGFSHLIRSVRDESKPVVRQEADSTVPLEPLSA